MTNKTPKVKKAVLVYQAGIANVFAVTSYNLSDYGRDARRLLQGAFTTCADFARGLQAAGVMVKVCACNQAGDIATAHWTDDLESQPFSDKFVTVTDTNSLARL